MNIWIKRNLKVSIKYHNETEIVCCKYDKPNTSDSNSSECESSDEDERNEYDRPSKPQRHFHR